MINQPRNTHWYIASFPGSPCMRTACKWWKAGQGLRTRLVGTCVFMFSGSPSTHIPRVKGRATSGLGARLYLGHHTLNTLLHTHNLLRIWLVKTLDPCVHDSPLLSAAPPHKTLDIKTPPSLSVFTVAPYGKETHRRVTVSLCNVMSYYQRKNGKRGLKVDS